MIEFIKVARHIHDNKIEFKKSTEDLDAITSIFDVVYYVADHVRYYFGKRLSANSKSPVITPRLDRLERVKLYWYDAYLHPKYQIFEKKG